MRRIRLPCPDRIGELPSTPSVDGAIDSGVLVGPLPRGTGSASRASVAFGATALYEGNMGAHTWVTMADPEGNEFCVSEPAIQR